MTTATISNKEVEETLRSVIQSLIDGQEGFKQIGEKLDDPPSNGISRQNP